MRCFKNSLALLLVLVMVLSLGACGRKTGYYVDGSEYTDLTDSEYQELIAGGSSSGDTASGGAASGGASGGTASGGTTSGGTASTVTTDRTQQSIWKIKRDVQPGASSSIMKSLNFKGKTLKYLTYNSNHTDGDKKNIAAFEKKYNCKIDVSIVNYEDYLSVLSTSLAGGKPYDIIKLHAGFFPTVAVSQLVQPLEKAISKDDLTSSSKKTGINWEATYLSCSWNNHIYYVLDRRVGALQMLIYNKLLFSQYGLEDPLELYKKGQWTPAKIEEMAKVVNASGGNIKFHNDAVSEELARLKYKNGANYYVDIAEDGTVKWLGANSAVADYYAEMRRFRDLAPLAEVSSSVEKITNGECMLDYVVAEQLNNYVNQFKTSQAFGKNLNNVGVVPMPWGEDGKYTSTGCEGFAAARGCDPTAAVAMGIFYSMQDPIWYDTEFPAIEANKDILEATYDKLRIRQQYVWRASDGRKGDEIIYPMYLAIDRGGDIMKLLQEYAPSYKTAVEYTLSNQ